MSDKYEPIVEGCERLGQIGYLKVPWTESLNTSVKLLRVSTNSFMPIKATDMFVSVPYQSPMLVLGFAKIGHLIKSDSDIITPISFSRWDLNNVVGTNKKTYLCLYENFIYPISEDWLCFNDNVE